MKRTSAKAASTAKALTCELARIGLMGVLLLGVHLPAVALPTVKTRRKPDLKISLLVYDYVGLSAGLPSRALDETRVIFGDAGVDVSPILCAQGKAPGGFPPRPSQVACAFPEPESGKGLDRLESVVKSWASR